MHVLRKLTGCLSSATCLNDQNTDSTTRGFSQSSSIGEDRTIENKVVIVDPIELISIVNDQQ